MAKIKHLSYSSMSLYLQCGLKYKLMKIDGIRAASRSCNYAFGSAVHLALEHLNKERMSGKNTDLKELQDFFANQWQIQLAGENIVFKDGESTEELSLIGRKMMELYYHRPYGKVAGIEVPFSVPIIDPLSKENLGIVFKGRVDYIEEKGGVNVIFDYKTSNIPYDQGNADKSTQLTLYSYAYEHEHQVNPGVGIINLTKEENPQMLIFESRQRDENDYKKLFDTAKKVFEGVRSDIFDPKFGPHCKSCECAGQCNETVGKKS